MMDELTMQFVEDNKDSDVLRLALQKEKYPNVNFAWAIQQIAARQKNKAKYPTLSQNLNFLFPVNVSVEQSSSEEAAQFKTTLLNGKTLIDLTAGFGIDVLTLAPNFEKAIAIEPNQDLCNLLNHNAKVLNISSLEVINDTAEHFLEHYPRNNERITFYIDPSRRDAKGERVNELEAYQPNLQFLQQLANLTNAEVFIKLSPMLDIRELQRLIPNIVAIYVLAVRNECKEVLLHICTDEASQVNESPIYAVNINASRTDIFTYNATDEILAPIAPEIKAYIYEPNVAIMKAGAYHAIAHHFNIEKLDRHTHLYTSNDEIPNFYGKRFKVIEVINFEKNNVKKVKGGNYQLICKNFPTTIEVFRKQMKIKEKGDLYLLATTVNGERVMAVCEKPIYN